MDPRSILIRPVVSEKSYAAMESGVYTFVVDPAATKPQVKEAVEAIFGVKVEKVNTLNRKGKHKRSLRSRRLGKRPDTKRAIVRLAKDNRIELFQS